MLSPTELHFRPGITKRTIEIETKNDSINEGDEVLFVSVLSNNASVQIDQEKGVTVVIIEDNSGECTLHVFQDKKLEILHCTRHPITHGQRVL